jgi:alkylation response protein AidB-like acyl-CoA dehydrogenase
MNKLNSTNIGHKVAKLSMEILGDEGMMAPSDRGLGLTAAGSTSASWVSQYMASLGIAIAGGTANIQRNVIAERGLGLPRDAAANRGN